MKKSRDYQELRDQYRHPGFYPSREVTVAQWDEGARVIRLTRRSKKRSAVDAVRSIRAGMIDGLEEYEISRVAIRVFFLNWKFVE